MAGFSLLAAWCLRGKSGVVLEAYGAYPGDSVGTHRCIRKIFRSIAASPAIVSPHRQIACGIVET